VPTNAVDAAVLLARAMTPLCLQPGWAEPLTNKKLLAPDARVTPETRQLGHHLALLTRQPDHRPRVSERRGPVGPRALLGS